MEILLLITSIWGQTGAACEVLYSTVKGAQISFVKSLSKELALNGIRVNGIAPGAVNTSMLANFSEEEMDMIKGEIPMGRLADTNGDCRKCFFFNFKKVELHYWSNS